MSSTVPHDMVLNSFILHSNHIGIDTIMIPVLDKKQKHLEAKYFAQAHPGSKWQSQV